VDLIQVHTNFEIGRRIVQEEQRGKDRAAYGQEVIKALAERLTDEFGTGFSLSNLKSMRQFYLQNQQRISQTVSGQFNAPSKSQSLTGQFASPSKSQTVSGQFGITRAASNKPSAIRKIQVKTGKMEPPPLRPFTLSWSHYVFLLGIKTQASAASMRSNPTNRTGQSAS